MPQYYDYEPFFITVSTEWDELIGDFVGRTINIGVTLVIVDTVENIDGIRFITKNIRFARLIDYHGSGCVVIEFEHSIDIEYSEMYKDIMWAFCLRPNLISLIQRLRSWAAIRKKLARKSLSRKL